MRQSNGLPNEIWRPAKNTPLRKPYHSVERPDGTASLGGGGGASAPSLQSPVSSPLGLGLFYLLWASPTARKTHPLRLRYDPPVSCIYARMRGRERKRLRVCVCLCRYTWQGGIQGGLTGRGRVALAREGDRVRPLNVAGGGRGDCCLVLGMSSDTENTESTHDLTTLVSPPISHPTLSPPPPSLFLSPSHPFSFYHYFSSSPFRYTSLFCFPSFFLFLSLTFSPYVSSSLS